jgi:hypothetical protein
MGAGKGERLLTDGIGISRVRAAGSQKRVKTKYHRPEEAAVLHQAVAAQSQRPGY